MDKDRFKKVVLNKLWIVAVITIIGIIVGIIIYLLADTAANPGTVYVGYSEYYVDFAWNDNTATTYDYYNAYTWNDIIGTDPVMDYAVEILPGMEKETLRNAVTAELPSDIRVIHTIITDTDANRVSAIQKAMEEAIVHFGDIMEEFEAIRVIRSDEVKPQMRIRKTDRAAQAGGIVGFLTGLFGVLIWYCLDDRILCPSDVRRIVPDIPCIGMNELAEANIDYLQKKYGELSLVKICGQFKGSNTNKFTDNQDLDESGADRKASGMERLGDGETDGTKSDKKSLAESRTKENRSDENTSSISVSKKQWEDEINEVLMENPTDIVKPIILRVDVHNYSGFGRKDSIKGKNIREQELLNYIDALKLRDLNILGIYLKDVKL